MSTPFTQSEPSQKAGYKYVQLKVAIAFAMYISGSCSFVVTIHNNMMFVCVR